MCTWVTVGDQDFWCPSHLRLNGPRLYLRTNEMWTERMLRFLGQVLEVESCQDRAADSVVRLTRQSRYAFAKA